MTDTNGGQQFYSALRKKAQAAVQDILNAPLYPVQYPSQGDFMYNWQNLNQVFNDDTYQYVSALVQPGDVPGTARLSPGGGFANGYVQLLNNISFALSTADQARLQHAQDNARVQAGTIITDYQNTFGTITDEQMKTAGVQNKQDYVVSYVLGSVWSGATVPLTWQQMSEARDLRRVLPKAPASADQVISDVVVYLNLMQPVFGLTDQLQYNAWMLRQLKNNAQYPTERNGGIDTFDPNTGKILSERNVGFGISSSVQSINNDLQNTGRTIQISMRTSQASGNQVNVSVEGEAGFSVGSWLRFDTAASGSYDMSSATGTSTDCSVTITYAGYSVVPISPSAWQQATNVGFYSADPVQQAAANQGRDVSGFQFVNQPPYNLAPFASGGNFGFLSNLLIANYPTISITYNHADFSAFSQSWHEQVSGNLTLLGFIKLGSFSQGAYGSSYKQGSDNSSFTVTFSASPEVVGVPQNQKTAYVIAGGVANPGVTA